MLTDQDVDTQVMQVQAFYRDIWNEPELGCTVQRRLRRVRDL